METQLLVTLFFAFFSRPLFLFLSSSTEAMADALQQSRTSNMVLIQCEVKAVPLKKKETFFAGRTVIQNLSLPLRTAAYLKVTASRSSRSLCLMVWLLFCLRRKDLHTFVSGAGELSLSFFFYNQTAGLG